jgi:hypothetical protein
MQPDNMAGALLFEYYVCTKMRHSKGKEGMGFVV